MRISGEAERMAASRENGLQGDQKGVGRVALLVLQAGRVLLKWRNLAKHRRDAGADQKASE